MIERKAFSKRPSLFVDLVLILLLPTFENKNTHPSIDVQHT